MVYRGLRHRLESRGPRENLTPIKKDFEESSIALQKVRRSWPPSHPSWEALSIEPSIEPVCNKQPVNKQNAK